MALAPNLHKPSWTTRSRFTENFSSAEIASSSLAPHAHQYMQRKNLFMPSAALRPSLQIPWQSLPFKKKKKMTAIGGVSMGII
ncbi:hypothetical protein ACFXTO_048209 [Malus domestica]